MHGTIDRAIIGVLAAVAMPAYNDYITRGKLAEAHSQLVALQLRMEQYYQDNRTYDSGSGCPAFTPTTATNFSYSCVTSSGGQGFTFTATGIAGSSTAGFTFTVNDTGAKATTAAPTGWSTSGSCWVRGKGGC